MLYFNIRQNIRNRQKRREAQFVRGRARGREREKERERANTPIFPCVWLTSCQHVFYLPDVFPDLSRAPLPPRLRAQAYTHIYRHIHTHVRWAHIPEVSRSWLPEKRRPPASLILVSLPVTVLCTSSSHRRAIRPRLSHRYSRGLLGARGKMRQVVVRSQSPGTREIRLLFSPPLVRPPARSAAPFIRAGILCARVSVTCVCIRACEQRAAGPTGPVGASRPRQVHNFCSITEAEDQLTDAP